MPILPIKEGVEGVSFVAKSAEDAASFVDSFVIETLDSPMVRYGKSLPETNIGETYSVLVGIEIERDQVTYMRWKEMSLPRRTFIAALGLAPASVALGTELFVNPALPGEERDPQAAAAVYSKERFAEAFERLAEAVRNDKINVHSLSMFSELKADSLADMYELKISMVHFPEAG